MSNSDYPIYSVDVLEGNKVKTSSNTETTDVSNCIAIGGGREGGFLGMPISLFNFDDLS
jgi:hypothetical protein